MKHQETRHIVITELLQELQPLLLVPMPVSRNPYKVDEHPLPPSLSVLGSPSAMRIYYLLFVLPFLFLMSVPGKMGREVSGLKELQRGQSLLILRGALHQGDLLYKNRSHRFLFC